MVKSMTVSEKVNVTKLDGVFTSPATHPRKSTVTARNQRVNGEVKELSRAPPLPTKSV